jgi:acetoin utilization deacetylase AcuC-like enzyme
LIVMKTGIFFHYQRGERLRDFPEVLSGILDKDNVFLYDAFYPSKPNSSFDLEPISVQTLLTIHSPEMVERVKATGDYEGALYSAAGTVAAATRIWSGEITNAFVFTGYGDHHAGSDFFGGGCYFNGAAIAIHELEEKFGAKRFAIIDTDAHHGDGTWELFESNSGVLYICFCSGSSQEKHQNVNIHVPFGVNDDDYILLLKQAFQKWAKAFQPNIIFWNWGYDGTIGEYGGTGLTPELQLRIARETKALAREVCSGRLVIILCGGGRRDLASFLIPQIIRILANINM